MENLVIGLVATFLLWSVTRWVRCERVKVIAVIDGDTLVILTRKGRRQKVRVHGIDAPELGQRGAETAKARMVELLHGQWVRARWQGTDRYHRRIATVYVGSTNAGAVLVAEGLAFALPGSGLAWRALAARMTWRGVYRPGQPRPDQAYTRRWPWLGWLKARAARRARAKARRVTRR